MLEGEVAVDALQADVQDTVHVLRVLNDQEEAEVGRLERRVVMKPLRMKMTISI